MRQQIDPAHINALSEIAGPRAIIDGDDKAPYLEEWRGRWHGEAPLVLAPSSTDELSKIMAYCHEHDIAVVPQGGNTGLVGGQVPTGEILITLKRMRRVREVSPRDFTMTLDAGVALAEAQDEAEKAGCLFPLSIGSEGTCQIGGILSTNAGGVNVIRYGNARDLVLGLEVVLPDGRMWNGLNRLRKNNTGYDLKHLFVGGEGTLGFITAAVLKLYPRPADQVTALLALPSTEAAVDLLSLAQNRSGGQITSFELMNRGIYELVLKHFPDLQRPVETDAPYYALLEFSSGRRDELAPMVEELLAEAFEDEIVVDGTIAAGGTQSEALWALRHNASEAMKNDPYYCVKCDISVPIHKVPTFIDRANAAMEKDTPGARIMAFGHMGDGNIHYDILGPDGADKASWKEHATTLEHAVHDIVADLGGSISAEHGIGVLKRDEMADRKSDVEMSMMRAVKNALDPKGLMNPGKVLQ
ncbi:FAD-binding oxidoreductase [Parvularcula sp. LCG005]|uniref:FAD-binding oxidoreductase n=1 Tax=Parvularcula sp. LCG005 TaxID=3078805 RepID=UPI002943777D|nr:FAD-binding oxidoreductase [Parvularcula sp. LCG005]WOI52071.1 FAD-binding oxidoreductase [Parvularcula sp. LCG005]